MLRCRLPVSAEGVSHGVLRNGKTDVEATNLGLRIRPGGRDDSYREEQDGYDLDARVLLAEQAARDHRRDAPSRP